MSAERLTWTVAGGWTVGVLLLALLWKSGALSLLLLLGILLPALAALPAAHRDERQRALDREASHLALGAVYLLAAGVVIHAVLVAGVEPDPRWYLVLALPLLVRPLLTVGRGSGPRTLGLGLGGAIGAFWLAFALLGHGPSVPGLVEGLVGATILLATATGARWPRTGGWALVALGLGWCVMLGARFGRIPPVTGALMTLILPLPLLVAGGALIASSAGDHGPPED